MEERIEDLLLIKNFLKLFDVYYEKIPYYSMIDLTNNGIIDLYQGNIKVGNLILKDDKYKINFNLDDISLKQFYDEYRRRNNLLFPNEIKKIREKYNMSQTEFAKLLGMGAKTITRYENGTIQERTHDNLIRAVNNNFVFSDFITRENKSNISDLKNYEIKGDKLCFNLEQIEQQKAKCFAFKENNVLGGNKKHAGTKLYA